MARDEMQAGITRSFWLRDLSSDEVLRTEWLVQLKSAAVDYRTVRVGQPHSSVDSETRLKIFDENPERITENTCLDFF